MMKKLLLITFLITSVCTINAQSTPITPTITIGNLGYALTGGGDAVFATRIDRNIPEDVVIPLMITNPATGMSHTVTAIGTRAFNNDAEVTNVVIPDGITFQGGNHFQEANALASLSLPTDIGQIPQAFIQGTQLTTITIPEGATSSGNFVFFQNPLLETVNLPSSLVSLQNSSFTNNPLLTNITLPENLTSLGTNSFSGSTGNALQTVTVLNPVPATIQASTFTTNTKANATLVVPDGTIAAYRAAAEWQDFMTIIDATGALSITTAEGIKEAVIDASNGQISVTGATLDAVYTISGQRVDEAINLPVGIYIVKISNGTNEEVVKVILD